MPADQLGTDPPIDAEPDLEAEAERRFNAESAAAEYEALLVEVEVLRSEVAAEGGLKAEADCGFNAESEAAEYEAHLADIEVLNSETESMRAGLEHSDSFSTFSFSTFIESYDESRDMALRNRAAFHRAKSEGRTKVDLEQFERTENGQLVIGNREAEVPVIGADHRDKLAELLRRQVGVRRRALKDR